MDIFWIVCGTLAFIYSSLWYYIKRTVWCRSQTCLVGKTAIVTGSNTGVGYHTALDFAKRGGRVILACRNAERAQSARMKIVRETGNEDVVVKIVNLGSFDSVRAFARDINETEKRLDILVNNAGAAGLRDKKSKDGLLLLMQVNYLSHFLLTNLLLDLLKKSAPSRIVNVSSIAAQFSSFDLEDLNRHTGDYSDYSNSKLCNILFTRELAERLKDTDVTAYSVHPGAVRTEIFRHASGYERVVVEWLKDVIFRTGEEGAQTSIYAAVARGIEDYSGEHFDNCEKTDPYRSADVPELSKKLWEKSERFVELKPEEAARIGST